MPDVAGGDKAVLRRAAHSEGLTRACLREKRAIQFGSRISKLHNVRAFGSNRAANRQHGGTASIEEAQPVSAPVCDAACLRDSVKR
jgi:hypothetical protein